MKLSQHFVYDIKLYGKQVNESRSRDQHWRHMTTWQHSQGWTHEVRALFSLRHNSHRTMKCFRGPSREIRMSGLSKFSLKWLTQAAVRLSNDFIISNKHVRKSCALLFVMKNNVSILSDKGDLSVWSDRGGWSIHSWVVWSGRFVIVRQKIWQNCSSFLVIWR